MNPYVVQQGDYLLKIAHSKGFNPDTVWKDPKNAELAAKRDPNVLHPGDILYVPDVEPPKIPVSGGTSNDYSAEIPGVLIDLVMQTGDGPLANEPYVVEGLPEPLEGSTDDDGHISIPATVHTREIRLVFPKRQLAHTVRIGDMDPIDEDAGVRKRFEHLGFASPNADDEDDPEEGEQDAQPVSAEMILAFQKAQGLEPTGQLDDATREKLKTLHGS